MKITRQQLFEKLQKTLNEGNTDVVKKIQVIIGEFPDEESASGKWL